MSNEVSFGGVKPTFQEENIVSFNNNNVQDSINNSSVDCINNSHMNNVVANSQTVTTHSTYSIFFL